jgi:hypothetical protein
VAAASRSLAGAAAALPAAARWPSLFLIGAPVSGSETVASCLAQHPQAFVPRVAEPHLFSGIERSNRMPAVVSGEPEYLDLYAAANGATWLVDASSSYLWAPDSANRIAKSSPHARIVLCLRDPIDRAWAHWQREAAAGRERRGFLRSVRDEMARPGELGRDSVYITASRYAVGVERYLALFGPDRVHVVFHEMLVADPRGTMRDLFTWLGIEEAMAALLRLDLDMDRPDPGPALEPVIRALLADYYLPDVARLTQLLGVVPPWTVQALERLPE